MTILTDFLPIFTDGKLTDPSTLNNRQLRLTILLIAAAHGPPCDDTEATRLSCMERIAEKGGFLIDPAEIRQFYYFCRLATECDIPGKLCDYLFEIAYFEGFTKNFENYRQYLGTAARMIPPRGHYYFHSSYTEHLFNGDYHLITHLDSEDVANEDSHWMTLPSVEYLTFPIRVPTNDIRTEQELHSIDPQIIASFPYTVAIFPKQDGQRLADMINDLRTRVKAVLITPDLVTEVLFRVDAANRGQWEEKAKHLESQMTRRGLVAKGFSLWSTAHCPC